MEIYHDISTKVGFVPFRGALPNPRAPKFPPLVLPLDDDTNSMMGSIQHDGNPKKEISYHCLVFMGQYQGESHINWMMILYLMILDLMIFSCSSCDDTPPRTIDMLQSNQE